MSKIINIINTTLFLLILLLLIFLVKIENPKQSKEIKLQTGGIMVGYEYKYSMKERTKERKEK